jgi:hypothetical protein
MHLHRQGLMLLRLPLILLIPSASGPSPVHTIVPIRDIAVAALHHLLLLLLGTFLLI